MSRSLFALFVLGLAALLPAHDAAATEFKTLGWRGDRQREVRCPDGSYLVGFAGWSGNLLNALQPICAPLLEDARLGNRKKLATYGGKGGSDTFTTYCEKNQIIQSWIVRLDSHDRTVGAVVFECYAPSTGGFGATKMIAVSGGAANEQACPSGELANGLKINYGKHVNGLGLICTEVVLPVAAAEAEAPPAAPTPMEIAAGFGGDWTTKVGDEAFLLTLTINGAQVSGPLTHRRDPQLNGTFYGTLEPNGSEILYITELNNGESSSGILTLSPDGKEITGMMTLNGQRQAWRGIR